MTKEHQMHQAILLEIMEEMQKDFYDTKWWMDKGNRPSTTCNGYMGVQRRSS